MSNLLTALTRIIQNPITDIVSHYKGSNRANSMGDALEMYVRDAFCESFHLTEQEKNQLYSQHFSYLGNQNNPPDIILKRGDALEVKKIESITSALALNSSYPKNKLYAHDTRITTACKNCETTPWNQKDIIYAVGYSPKGSQKLKALFFVYGDCYAAHPEIYTRISETITGGIQQIPDVEFVETNELAKVKKVDPLGITDLRVRGMWHIENPFKVFQSLAPVDLKKDVTLHALIPKEKYEQFPHQDRENLERFIGNTLMMRDAVLPSPSNPAQQLPVRLISYAT